VRATPPPSLIALAGPNGAGKSTAGPALLKDTLGVTEFVNADLIAQGLSPFAPETAALAAGRIMLTRLRHLARRRVTFAFETTLAGRAYAPWIARLIDSGYELHLVFLWLRNPELAIQRVADRVRQGGHNVPKEVVRRRYHRGLDNFRRIYRPLATTWRTL
jgi:predicted ABC-type ATPase